jgi:hypothetical protein
MAIAKYNNKCNPARCFDSAEYITRLSKAEEIHFYNLDKIENSVDKDDLENRRAAAMAYGETRQKESAANPRIKNSTPKIDKDGKEIAPRQDRNHQTLILTWDRNESSEKAAQMTKEFLDDKFSDARCIYAIHQDKNGQTHAHVFIDTKKENEKSFQLKAKDFYTLDEAWAKKYDKEYKTRYAPEFKKLKEETRAYNERKIKAKNDGKDFTEKKPERSNDKYKKNLAENLKKRDLQNAGVKRNDKTGIDRDKRFITTGHSSIKNSEQTLDNSERKVDRAAGAVDGTIREAKTLHSDITKRDISRDRSKGRGR